MSAASLHIMNGRIKVYCRVFVAYVNESTPSIQVKYLNCEYSTLHDAGSVYTFALESTCQDYLAPSGLFPASSAYPTILSCRMAVCLEICCSRSGSGSRASSSSSDSR